MGRVGESVGDCKRDGWLVRQGISVDGWVGAGVDSGALLLEKEYVCEMLKS